MSFGEKRLLKEVIELKTFFHYGAASIVKFSKGAVKKSLGTAVAENREEISVDNSLGSAQASLAL